MTEKPNTASLLEVLDQHAVSYVVTGSVAAAAHGASDAEPADLDIVPATDPVNLGRLGEALAALGSEPPSETGEWRTDEAGEHVWHRDGIDRPPRPLDPADPETFDHPFPTPFGSLDVVPASPVRMPICGAARRASRSRAARRGSRIRSTSSPA